MLRSSQGGTELLQARVREKHDYKDPIEFVNRKVQYVESCSEIPEILFLKFTVSEME